MENKLICDFKLAANVVRGGIRWFVYYADRPAILKRNLVRLGVDGNRQVWVRDCGGETVSIHTVRERAAGFFNVKSTAYIALELVNKVHRLEVGMGSYGVSEVSTRADE